MTLTDEQLQEMLDGQYIVASPEKNGHYVLGLIPPKREPELRELWLELLDRDEQEI